MLDAPHLPFSPNAVVTIKETKSDESITTSSVGSLEAARARLTAGREGRDSPSANSFSSVADSKVDCSKMTELSTKSDELQQLVDYDGNFVSTVGDWLRENNLTNVGFDFSVLTVLGCQSGGKSTLLNSLFGTGFPVMNAALGRSQTTRGLWIARDNWTNTMVIDVEGTDSKERGEDRGTFEHRASLFSLALADVVIVNMWYHDMGRYTASNYGLLRTVLEVNLELFQKQSAPRTVMLFVIRDFCAETPLETLERTINGDIHEIWQRIRKPDVFAASNATDFFDFHFVGLPSQKSNRVEFELAVSDLRKKWQETLRPRSYTRKIPADGFFFYCQSVWETILSSQELDIPTQKELLATFRCDELKAAALALVQPILEAQLQAALAAPVTSFDWAASLVADALGAYDTNATRYDSYICGKKRRELLVQVHLSLQKIVDAHLGHIRSRVLGDAQKRLEKSFESKEDDAGVLMIGGLTPIKCWEGFSEIIDQWQIDALNSFEDSVAGLMFEMDRKENEETLMHEFTTDGARSMLVESLESLESRERDRQSHLLYELLAEMCSNRVGGFESLFVSRCFSAEGFWKEVLALCILAKSHGQEALHRAWKSLSVQNSSTDSSFDVLVTNEVLRQMRLRIERLVKDPSFIHHILARFSVYFDSDAEGVPRVWQAMDFDGIRRAYVEAKSKSLEILDALADVKIDLSSFLPDGISSAQEKKFISAMMTPGQKAEVVSQAEKKMARCCQEAQIVQATGARGGVPSLWFWIILIILGWNEMMAILRSPLLLMGLMFAALGAGATYYTGNVNLVMELVRHLANTILGMALPIIRALQESVTPPPITPHRKDE